jgi:hypothetical protein
MNFVFAVILILRIKKSDGHNDFPYILRGWYKNQVDSADFDIQKIPIGQTDLARLSRGMVGGQFWSAFVPWFPSPLRPFRQKKIKKRLPRTNTPDRLLALPKRMIFQIQRFLNPSSQLSNK